MRAWLHQQLTDIAATITEGGPSNIYQNESMLTAVEVKPFWVYSIGNMTSELLSEDMDPGRQFFQIYVHDEGADYSRIDDHVEIIKAGLRNKNDKDARIINVIFLETSRDLDDQSMGTLMRYIRFQAIVER